LFTVLFPNPCKEISMKGFKTFIFFGALALSGILTMLNADAIESVLQPALCQLDPAALPDVPTECMTRVVAAAGAVMTFVGIAGKVLRAITTTTIFRPE
jgi:hypothetical protein